MLTRAVVKMLGGIWTIRRKARITRVRSLKRAYEFLYTSFLQSKGSWISLSARFEGEACFPHGIYGIFISGGSVIGINCVIFQHVTIGSNALIDSNGIGAPTIGDNCYIGAGAKIIGNLRIGKNVRVGSNATVYQDVPDNCVVTSGKQEIKKKCQPLDNHFYHKYKGKWVYFENGTWVRVQSPDQISLLERSFSN